MSCRPTWFEFGVECLAQECLSPQIGSRRLPQLRREHFVFVSADLGLKEVVSKAAKPLVGRLYADKVTELVVNFVRI